MACFPKIDQPCPLGIEEQKRIDGYCGRCSKAVHSLDAMSDADRLSFMRNASGPICVSYRVNVRRGAAVGLGVALALSVAAPAHADPVGTEVAPTPAAQTTSDAPLQSVNVDQKLETIMMLGGVSDPGSVALVDEDEVPDLPMVREQLAPRQ
jgi:hypothetical protein